MLLAQWSGLGSLRQIVAALRGQARSFYHLNLREPYRTTLADANAARPSAVFRDIAQALLPVAAEALGRTAGREGNELIRLLDASPILLDAKRFTWAEANPHIRGLKLHLMHDPREHRPVWFEVTSAKVDDLVAGRRAPIEEGAVYVFDKGYTDYQWWSRIIQANSCFVTRIKCNARRRAVTEMPASGDGILADRRLKIGHRQARGGAPQNPLYNTMLREIEVERPDHDTPLRLITNDLTRPAAEIAQLYKERWAIELMFKWLKQNLKIKSFLGRSENAVRIQIYTALIAFLLLRILHQTAARALKASPTILLAQIKVALFSPFSLQKPNTPPPKPPCLRPPTPQLTFRFQ